MTGPGKNRVFVIAEAGSNWKAGSAAEDWERIRALIDAAAKAGADAVKFQTFRAQTVYVPNAGSSDYLSKNGVRQSITGLFKYLSIPYEMIPRLAALCRRRKIEFMSSFFSPEDFRAVDPFVRIHKIASYEISHPELIALAAKSGKPLILSTGASVLEEIDWAVQWFRKNGGRQISLMQCTAKYPAPMNALNLHVISELARRYGVSVGFSDHSEDPVVGPVAAVALGAKIIEKHFTLSRKFQGPDHAFAVEPAGLTTMVRAIRACEKALGNNRKCVLLEEKELYDYAKRAVQAVRDIAKGERFILNENIAVLRPGKQKKGVHPMFLSRISGKAARRFIPLGSGVRLQDVAL